MERSTARTTSRGIAAITAVLLMTSALHAAVTAATPSAAKPRPASPQGLAKSLGAFDAHGDIGAVSKPGSVSYDPVKQEYLIEGAGTNMWFSTDEGHFLWKKLRGDFILSAKVEFIGQGVASHRKIGWMARAGLETDAAHASAVVHGDGLTSMQFRRTQGAQTEEDQIGISGPNQIQLERRGTSFIMSVARFGETVFSDKITNVPLGDEVYAGLFVCSHHAGTLEKARFSNVRIVIPAKPGFVPYQDYIGSNLEILDVESGARTIIYQTPASIQAPNWTRDGRALIYNENGLLYRYDLASNIATVLDTGAVKDNTNDHALSFDGRMLGISSSPESGGESAVFTVPVTGGSPTRVTRNVPSYLHGWSPDGRYLVFTGGRKGKFDVYKIPAAGGPEVRLTKARGLNDGPEYAPHGRSIYFNSNRKGGMRIWMMRPDGKGQRQITFDSLQDWFPHVSPDGKWIAFLSYTKDVAPSDHPFYKQVYLRLIPAGGGYARVIAYVYGGQGTMNVASWSPDGKKLAFVSNTGGLR